MTDSRAGLLGVTIDHGQSFNEFLNGKLQELSSLEVKLWLYRQLSELGCDWIVVSLDLLTAGVRSNTGLWLGSRDFVFEKESAHAISFAWNELLLSAKESGCEGVKVGLIIGRSRALMPKIRRAVRSLGEEARGAGLRVILEPTFEGRFSQRDYDWLFEVQNVGVIDFLKLPLTLDASFERFVQEKRIAWFARSNTLSIEDYVAGIKAAGRFGCIGTLVGRAVWHDCLTFAAESGLNELAASRLESDLGRIRDSLRLLASH